MKEDKEEKITYWDRKITSTAFILMFPTLLLAGIAVYFSPLGIGTLAVAITFYQFLMLRKFIEDYYRK